MKVYGRASPFGLHSQMARHLKPSVHNISRCLIIYAACMCSRGASIALYIRHSTGVVGEETIAWQPAARSTQKGKSQELFQVESALFPFISPLSGYAGHLYGCGCEERRCISVPEGLTNERGKGPNHSVHEADDRLDG